MVQNDSKRSFESRNDPKEPIRCRETYLLKTIKTLSYSAQMVLTNLNLKKIVGVRLLLLTLSLS